jgi:hypothetical protein
MRRWPIWTGVAILLLAIGAALTQIPPAPPFEFLRGQTPVEFKPGPSGHMGVGVAYPRPVFVYTFRADYDQLKDKAEREINPGPRNDPSTHLARSFPNHEITASTSRGEVVVVGLFKDYRADALRSVHGSSRRWTVAMDAEEGWVTVVIDGMRRPTWFDSFRSWLGI